MDNSEEVKVYCPSNYNFVKHSKIPWLRFGEIAIVVFPIMYLLWTINFTMTIKFLGTVIVGIPLFFILLIGYRGKSIGQIILLSINFSYNKVRLHLRSVNDDKPNTSNNIPNVVENTFEKAKEFVNKFSKNK